METIDIHSHFFARDLAGSGNPFWNSGLALAETTRSRSRYADAGRT
ncbi:MAG: hypothetical protein CM1200mP18_15650 [Gammaproteobacteria bacterium]|nr:MAG: hypothetical protein CM1200mP18_15650 [Gammaproteobacteria bacterium]